MSVLWGLMIILLISAGWSVILKRTLAETAVVGFGTVIFVLYCFGLLNFQGCLRIGYYTLVALSIASLALIIRIYMKDGKKIIEGIQFIQGTALLAVAALFVLAVTYGRFVCQWDEFTLWGTRVKFTSMYDALTSFSPKALSPVLQFSFYPPGSSIWGYFFSVGGFADWKAYFANSIIPFLMIMPFLKDIFSKLWLKRVILLAFGVIFFSSVFLNLLVDTLLGLLFGFAVLYYLTFDRDGDLAGAAICRPQVKRAADCRPCKRYHDNLYRTALVSTAVFLLAMTKDTGGLFAIGICLLILIDCLLFNRKNKNAWIYSIIPLGFASFFMLSWKIVNSAAVAMSGEGAIGGANIISLFTGRGLEEWQKNVIKQSFGVFLKGKGGFLGSCLISLAIFAAVSLAFGFANHVMGRKRMGRVLLWTAGLSLGMILYAYMIIYPFIFSFTQDQGERLFGYGRYMLTYQIALVMTGFHLMLPFKDYDEPLGVFKGAGYAVKNLIKLILNPQKLITAGKLIISRRQLKKIWRFSGAALSVLLILVMSLNKWNSDYEKFSVEFSTYSEHQSVTDAKKWAPYLREDSQPVFVLINYDEFTAVIFHIMYAFTDPQIDTRQIMFEEPEGVRTLVGNWRFYHRVVNGKELLPDDMCTLDCTPDEWTQFLRSHGYGKVYVYYADDHFRENFGMFFSDGVQDDMLYDIEYDEDGMRLVKIENWRWKIEN